MTAFPKVSVIGLGYIGLPTAALIASRGIPVHGVDISERIVATIAAGSIHISEPDLDGLVVCRRIREWSDVPIIVLSAAGSEERKIAALLEGAPEVILSANVGCLAHLEPAGAIPVRHWIEWVDGRLAAGLPATGEP